MTLANTFTSNVMKKVARVFNKEFEYQRKVSRTINIELIKGMHKPSTGGTVYTKRPHQYINVGTTDGDLTGKTKNSIQSGQVAATIQDWITVPMEWAVDDEMKSMDQLEQMVNPAARTCVIELENKVQQFAANNFGLSYGVPGNVVNKGTDVSMCNAQLNALGVPDGMERYYVMNPFNDALLADSQSGLSNEALTKSAWERAMSSKKLGGFNAMSAGGMYALTTGTITDRIGAVNAAPDMTYDTAKDTITQTLVLKNVSASLTATAGEIIEYSTVYQVNPLNQNVIYGPDGNPLKFRQTITAAATASAGGVLTLVVTPAALKETNGQYNNIDAVIAINDVVTILGNASTAYQPNLFYHKDAMALASIEIPKTFTTDKTITTEDGISIRVSRYGDGDANENKIRFDLVIALSILNPLFGGKSYGVPA